MTSGKPQWVVVFHDEFMAKELQAMDAEQRISLFAAARALEHAGPAGGRPLVGTLKQSRHANMKELRYEAHGGSQVWRAAFAFDPERTAVVLAAADKQGKDSDLFYSNLLGRADRRYDRHLRELKTRPRSKK
jgi:hypothetical protein